MNICAALQVWSAGLAKKELDERTEGTRRHSGSTNVEDRTMTDHGSVE